jgi:DNA/RNA endonuclease G (NUC1)
LNKTFDIVQRAYDKKFVVFVEAVDPGADEEFYIKNNLQIPQIWVPIAVTFTRDAAIRASKAYRSL